MDFNPSEEQRMIIDQVRRYLREEIWPLEEKLDPDAGELEPADYARLVAKTKAMGLYGLDAPAEYGGPGIDLVTRTLIAMEISQHRAGLYLPCYNTFGVPGPGHLFAANAEQKERYLFPTMRGEMRGFFAATEPGSGSDLSGSIKTKAVQDGDDWLLSGSKIFISSADRAQYGITFARTDPDSKGARGLTCFIIDTDQPGFIVRRIIHTLRAAHLPTEIELDNLRVPSKNIIGEVGRGLEIANSWLNRTRIPYAAGCIGAAIRAQEMAVEYAQLRETHGAKLSTRQAIQWMLVDNEIDIRTARLLTLQAAQRADQNLDFRTEASIAKLFATEAAGRVVDRAMQIFGGYGMTKDLPLERWYRELRIKRIGEGTSEIQRITIARGILGKSTGTTRKL
jgi:alkylation response protein AidB-like acyl-CoA dehydrogenase